MDLLKCENCGSSIPVELWKKDGDNLVCPACGKTRVAKVNLEKTKVSLKKDEEKNELILSVNSPKIEPKNQDVSFIDVLDSGLKSIFGSAVSPCPDCGKIICICSLKSAFNK